MNPSKPIKEFVAELNGRYREHISDVMLERLLLYLIECRYRAERSRKPDIEPEATSLVYQATVGIFESILEYDCKAGGNGHHVAQDLARKFA